MYFPNKFHLPKKIADLHQNIFGHMMIGCMEHQKLHQNCNHIIKDDLNLGVFCDAFQEAFPILRSRFTPLDFFVPLLYFIFVYAMHHICLHPIWIEYYLSQIISINMSSIILQFYQQERLNITPLSGILHWKGILSKYHMIIR